MPRKQSNKTRGMNLCFSNLMQPFTPESPPTSPTATSSSILGNDIIDHNRPSPTATSSTMIKNFNTLYGHNHTRTLPYSSSLYPFLLSKPEPEPEPQTEPADFATAFASQRFFFSSPGRSNSIVESTNTDCTSSTSSSSMAAVPPSSEDSAAADKEKKRNNSFFEGCVAVPTYSTDPYLDFRQSMQEMVEARPELMDVKSNSHVLPELLLCYLALNPTTTHEFILGAFSDLLDRLMLSFSSLPPSNSDPGEFAGGGDGC